MMKIPQKSVIREKKKIKFNFGDPDKDILLTREQYFHKQFLKTKSTDSEYTARAFVRMLDYFTEDIYQSTIEELIAFIKEETQEDARRRNSTVHLLEEFNQWLQVPHPHIIPPTGRPKLAEPKRARKYNNYEKKTPRGLKGNGFLRAKYTINGIKKFIGLTQGIDLTKSDMDRVINYPVMPEDRELDEERAEPTTSEQMREVVQLQRNIRSRTLYEMINDGAWRMIECWKLQERDIKWGTSPLEIKLLPSKSKGGYGPGTRYACSKTESDLRKIVTGDPERHFLRLHEDQNLAHFRDNERKKIRIIYDKLKMTQRFPDSGQHMYNMHSIRKRSTNEYGRKHGEAMGHGYGRHKKYLGQYNAKSADERREMFLTAQIYMAIDELEQQKSLTLIEKQKNENLKKQKDEEIIDRILETLYKQKQSNEN